VKTSARLVVVVLSAFSSLASADSLRAQEPPTAKRPVLLRRSSGRPFFLSGPGDPEGFLYRGKRRLNGTRAGDQIDLIHKLKATGANSIYIEAVRSHGGDGGPTENPFTDSDPRRGVDMGILDQWEDWFRLLDNSGIATFFIFYDDGVSPFGAGDAVSDREADFLRRIVERFRHRERFIWCVAEEYEEALSPKRVSAIASHVKRLDPAHPVAVHKLHGLDFREFADDPAIDLFAVQYNVKSAAELHAGMVRAFGEARGRYGIIMSEAEDHGTGEPARKKSWAAALGGAQVMVLGMDIAGTPVSDLEDCGRLARFMESVDYPALAPRDELRHAGTEFVLAAPPETYVAYAPELQGELGLKGLRAGRYTLRWLDCRSGDSVEEKAVLVTAGENAWRRPDGLGREIVLHLRRERVFPSASWAAITPAEAGLDERRLQAFRDHVGGRGCVARGGFMVFTWGDQERSSDVASAVKPWFTHFLFQAVAERKIAGLDEPVARFEPRLEGLNSALGFKDRSMTFRHLASQTSCYGVEEKPGAAYDYSDFNMALFFDTLFLKVYGATIETVDAAVLRPRLTDLIGCEDRPSFLAFGAENRPGRLAISVRDFARFGLLYLHRGEWNGTRIFSEFNAATAVGSPLPASLPRTAGKKAEMIAGQRSIGGGNNQTDHKGSYSLAWWTNGVDREGKRHWPGAPEDAFGAIGHGGMRAMVVIRSLDLIASWNDSPNETPEKEAEAMRLLSECALPR